MRILRVRLLAPAALRAELERFYGAELGLPAAQGEAEGLAFGAGPTVLDFRFTAGEPFYHFALRVPRNRFAAARAWLARRAELLVEAGSDETTFAFDAWNAKACYTHDPVGNILELIAHRELPEETSASAEFTSAELLGVCELGLVGPEPPAMARALADLGIELWDGTLDVPGRLAFMGDREGTLILAPTGRGWMPTGRPAEPHPVEAVVAGDREGEVTLPGTTHRIRTAATPAVRLAGRWSSEEHEAFERAVADTEQIDEELWR